jgi:hypothetical protein
MKTLSWKVKAVLAVAAYLVIVGIWQSHDSVGHFQPTDSTAYSPGNNPTDPSGGAASDHYGYAMHFDQTGNLPPYYGPNNPYAGQPFTQPTPAYGGMDGPEVDAMRHLAETESGAGAVTVGG